MLTDTSDYYAGNNYALSWSSNEVLPKLGD